MYGTAAALIVLPNLKGKNLFGTKLTTGGQEVEFKVFRQIWKNNVFFSFQINLKHL